MSRAMLRTCRPITPRARRYRSFSPGASPVRDRISVALASGASGLRSSCARVAKNDVLAAVGLAQRALGRAPLGHLGRERFVHGLERVRPLGDAGLQLVADAAELGGAPRVLDGVTDGALETTRVEPRLDEEIRGAALHRAEVDRAFRLGGHHDHRRAVPDRAIRAQEVEAASLPEPAVDEIRVETSGRHRVEGGLERSSPLQREGAAQLVDEAAEQRPVLPFVADQEDAERPGTRGCRHRESSG